MTTAGPKDLIEIYYDTHASVYEYKHGVGHYGQFYNFKKHYEPYLLGGLPQGGRVLELGCGTGVYTRWLLDRGFEVVAMDLSTGMIEQARHHCPEATFLKGDCENPGAAMPDDVRDADFDAIMGINTFCYYPNKAVALQNFRELLVPGGRLVLIEPNWWNPIYPLGALFNKNENRIWFHQIKEMTNKSVARMVLGAGFDILNLGNFAFVPNGVPKAVVAVAGPFDRLFGAIPFLNRFSMRITLTACRPDGGSSTA